MSMHEFDAAMTRAAGRPRFLAGPGEEADTSAPRLAANFAAIERYNTADSYVIAVGHLADRLRGGDPILADWPDDRALTGPERRELQQLLTDAGHSTQGVDGRIGPNTIDAIRDYQQAQGLVPDGYAAPALLTRLRG